MNALIICFSQTGNTRKIAECIREGIEGTGVPCDIQSLQETNAASLGNYDLIGIGSPVFYYKEPFHVRDFIRDLPSLEGRHWFVFCTHGNVIGDFFPSMRRLLTAKGALIIGYHNSYSDIAVPFYPRPSYTSGHPDAFDLEEARAFGREVAARSPQIADKDSSLLPHSYPVSSERWALEAGRMTEEVLAQVMPKLRIDSDTCIQCRECEENCPVQGIDIEADPPRIQDPCIYCWRCVNVCPTLSIGTDWTPLVAMAPANYARYKEELDEASAGGRFRWLVDPQSIVFDDPLYRQRVREIKGNPQG
jgi:flavodoxin/ferredoxin